MNRKLWFAVCCAVAIGFRFYNNAHGRADEVPLLLVPFVIAWTAFILPAIFPVVLIEEGAFHFAAWSDGHTMTTMFCGTLLACLFWFFPPRLARWFGTFDAFKEGPRRRPLLLRGAAYALDAMNKRLFGRQKTGGWA